MLMEIWGGVARHIPNKGLILRCLSKGHREIYTSLPLKKLYGESFGCAVSCLSSDLPSLLQSAAIESTSLWILTLVQYLTAFPEKCTEDILAAIKRSPGYSCLRHNALLPLVEAIRARQPEMVAFLAGAIYLSPSKAYNPRLWTFNPLYVAVQTGEAAIVRALVDHSTDESLISWRWCRLNMSHHVSALSESSWSPYTEAIKMGDKDVIEQVTRAYRVTPACETRVEDLPPTDEPRPWERCLEIALSDGPAPGDMALWERKSCLLFACMHGRARRLPALPAVGDTDGWEDWDGHSYEGLEADPLSVAILANSFACVEVLLKDGLKGGVRASSRTVSRHAGLVGDIRTVQALNTYGLLNHGKALRAACEAGHVGIVDYIITAGPPIKPDPSHFFAAASRDHLGVAMRLVRAGYAVTAETLLYALEPPTLHVFEYGLGLLAQVDETGWPESRGYSLLHSAAQKKRAPAVRLLIARGADVNMRSANRMAERPLRVAMRGEGAGDIVELLVSHGAHA